MLIEIDLEEIKSLKITINQFLLVKCIIEKISINDPSGILNIDSKDIIELKEKNILTPESEYNPFDMSKLKITEDFSLKFKVRDFFDEFYELYPVSVLRPDRTKDYLRGDISRCRKYYNKIVGKSKTKHESMLECLKFELMTRKNGNTLQYMKRMAKWLLAEEWLLYDEFMKDKSIVKHAEEIYGTTVE